MVNFARPQKLPVKLNPNLFYYELIDAAVELGNLNGLQKILPNPNILISPLLSKEAIVSSKIEGTRTTIFDALKYEATGEIKYNDTVEVVNYKKAMLSAIKELKYRPINISFIKELHSILLEHTRGHNTRGEFRKNQVWIGRPNDTIETASYVPPEPVLIPEYMKNLEKYILENGEHPLIKIGIIHYQFEAIHPFNDGNGRIGRLLIPLYLYWKGLLFQPILYISGYFEKYRDRYIDELHKVDITDQYESWIKFFLISVKNQSKETQNLINQILNLKNEVEKLLERVKSPYIGKIINSIFSKPILKSSDLNIEPRTSRRLLNKFEELGILKVLNVRKTKGRVYVFTKLIKLLSY